ncbi:MAG: hypothetical protein WCA27_30125 [Candidatus Sulfotelmatobacter sp.]
MATKTTKRTVIRRSPNRMVGLRIDPALVEQVRQRAKENERTIGNEMNRVLRAGLAQAERRA